MRTWVITLRPELYALAAQGIKTQTRRLNLRYLGVNEGDTVKFKPTRLGKCYPVSFVATAEGRKERLHDISGDDAMAEGVKCSTWGTDDWVDSDGYGTPLADRRSKAIEDFEELWESINGPGSWDRNDDVAVIEFKPVEGLK